MGSYCISTPTAISAVVAHRPRRLTKVTFVPLLILSANQPPTGRRAPDTRGPTNAIEAKWNFRGILYLLIDQVLANQRKHRRNMYKSNVRAQVCLFPKDLYKIFRIWFSLVVKLSMKRVISARITTSGTIHMKAALARYTALPLMIAGVTPNTLPSAARTLSEWSQEK